MADILSTLKECKEIGISMEQLIEAMENSEKPEKEPKTEYDLFGYDEEGYFFYSDRSKMIKKFSVSSIKQGNLIEIASESVWANNFVAKMVKNAQTGAWIETDRCDWVKSADLIVEAQQKVGKYIPGRIRGIGSWIDGKDHVINLGNKLIVNFHKKIFDEYKGKYFYYPNNSKNISIDIDKTDYNFSALIEFSKLIDFREEVDRICFIGFIAQTAIFSTQRWRSYIWLLAPKGSGKSSLMEFLSNIVHNNIATQDSTVAGIRQTAGCNAMTVLYDEAEGDHARADKILEFARGCASQSGFKSLRGTPSGNSMLFNDELLFCLASIRQPNFTSADESRWLNVRLEIKNYENAERVQRDSDRLYAMKDAIKLKDDLFVYMNKNLNKFNDLKDDVTSCAKLLGLNARQADQYSNFIAGYSLISGESVDDILNLIKIQEYDDIKYEGDDYDDMMNVFLDTRIRTDKGESTIGTLLDLSNNISSSFTETNHKYLNDYGIFITNGELRISNNHELNGLVRNKSIYPNIYKALKNHPLVSSMGVRKNKKKTRRCICFNFNKIINVLDEDIKEEVT